MKIWLDDVRSPPDDTWTHCTSVTAACITLAMYQQEVEEVSFDHDLGEDENGNELPNGNVFARIIEEKAYTGLIDPIEWNVHSANSAGRDNIIATMKSAERFWRERA